MPMVAIHAAPSKDLAEPEIPVRTLTSSDLNLSLREGWNDFLSMRGDLIFIGMLYPLVGLVAAWVTQGSNVLPLFFPIAAGISLLGPIVAVGFYELARRREAGLESDWSHFFDVRKRPSADGLGAVAALLVGIFALWMAVAAGLYLALWGASYPESIGAFLTRLFTTSEGWALIVIGNLVGACFAVLVLAISFVALPMLVDCNIEARTAVDTSIRAFRANKGKLIRWGFTVGILLVLGSIPVFIGLAVVLPWLGYATWHLYTHVIDRSALEVCQE
jgi:Predicted integral membrane protein